MTPVRFVFIVLCLSIVSGAAYLSYQGVWAASSGVTSVRTGSYGVIGGGGRVK